MRSSTCGGANLGAVSARSTEFTVLGSSSVLERGHFDFDAVRITVGAGSGPPDS